MRRVRRAVDFRLGREAFLKDSTTYDNKTIVDALINVGFRMFLEPMNLAEIRAAVQEEIDNGERESRPADAS